MLTFYKNTPLRHTYCQLVNKKNSEIMVEYYQETYEEKGRKKQQAEECNTQDNNNRSRIDKK